MLTLVNSNKGNHHTETPAAKEEGNKSGEELLISFLLWEQKFAENSHTIFEDPIDVFLCAQKEKPLTVI